MGTIFNIETQEHTNMFSQQRLAIVALVLAVVVLSAGCISGLGGDSGGDDVENSFGTIASAEELQTAATETMEGVETYSFVMEMSLDSSMGDLEMEMEGVADIGAEKMRADAEIEGSGQSLGMIQYVIEDTQYVEAEGSWFKQGVPNSGTPWQQHQLANQQALLENASIEVVDNRSFEGHPVRVVEMDVSGEFAKKQMLEYQEITENEAARAIESVSVQNFEATMYIDAETQHIRHVEAEMQYTVDGNEADMSMTMTTDNFDEPVDIELPEEAEGAGEFPS
jgi:hypothetical protein